MKLMIIVTVLFCFLLMACEKEKTVTEIVEVEVPEAPFSCEVLLQNELGEPLDGYLVQLSSYNVYSLSLRPVTQIRFTIDDYGFGSCPTKLVITDYWDRFVSMPIDENLPSGAHSLIWSGRNYLGETVEQGVYKGHLTVWWEDAIAMQDTLYVYLLQCIGDNVPGVRTTTSDGFAMFDDIQPLPGLYCTYAFPMINEYGEFEGYMNLSANSFIFVQDTEGDVRYTRKEMIDGVNSFTITWEEMTTVY